MVITFLDMCNKNQSLFTMHMETKKYNIPEKNKHKKTLLMYNKDWTKIYHELIIYNIIIYETTALLTQEHSNDYAASEIRFWSL